MNQPVRRARLPPGVQTFREVRAENLYYVDNTHFALQLLSQGKHFFLSRPRFFGKSLFVSMLQELFEGHRELFRDLATCDEWGWSIRRPVLLLDSSQVSSTLPGGLDASIRDRLLRLEIEHGLERHYATHAARLEDQILTPHQRSGRRVVLLVGEYDKPIVAALHVSLFSSLDNLNDLTLAPRYSSLCGYANHDHDTVFAPELPGLDRDRIRQWYNGYSWGGRESLYNPFDILLLLDKVKFRPWWFETGTPRFLPDTLVRRNISTLDLESLPADEALPLSFDIDEIGTEALLFRTGYLTLADWSEDDDGETAFRLGYPNRELQVSLNRILLSSLINGLSKGRLAHCRGVAQHIRAGDFRKLQQALYAFFATILDSWQHNYRIRRYEGYYAAVFFALHSGFGLDTRPEEASSRGSLDLAVITPERIALFKFKTVQGREGSGNAQRQIKNERYTDQHLASGKPVDLVGIEFSIETGNVALVAWETGGTGNGGTAVSSAPAPWSGAGSHTPATARAQVLPSRPGPHNPNS